MLNIRILITDNCHPILKQRLENAGFICDEIPAFSKDELIQSLHLYNAAIVRSKFIVDQEFIDAGTNLKCIARLGSGMETIDVNYATAKGIICVNSPEGNRDAVAEHALAMLLCLQNKLHLADAEVRKGFWNRESNRGIELKGKTVGIIGFGNMGAAFAKRLQSFDVNILAYDKYKTHYAPSYVTESTLAQIFEKSDIISLHIPLTEETNYMVDTAFLQSFKKDVFLINTARGKILKTKDLVTQLKLGKVKGACLDVLEYENMLVDGLDDKAFTDDFNYLKEASNVLLTPHIAGWTIESKYKLADVLATKIIEQLT